MQQERAITHARIGGAAVPASPTGGWWFSGKTASGRAIRYYVAGEDEAEARVALRRAGVQAEELRPRRVSAWRRRRRPRRVDLAGLADQLADQLEAGVPVVEACHNLSRAASNLHLAAALGGAAEQVRQGHDLAEAFARQHDPQGRALFPATFVSALRIGHRTGETTEMLKQFAGAQLKADLILSRIRSALIYPGLVALVAVAVALVFLYVVMPQLAEFYTAVAPAGGDTSLPLLTRVMMAANRFLLSWPGVLAAGVVLLALIVAGRWGRSPAGRVWLGRRSIRWPVLGGLLRDYHAAVCLRNLALLAPAGGSPDRMLAEAEAAATNPAYQEMLADVRYFLSKQSPNLPTLFAPYAYLMGQEFNSVLVTQDKTGKLEVLFSKYAQMLENRVDRCVERASRLIEPLLIMAVALFIGLFVIAVYGPLFQMVGRIARSH